MALLTELHFPLETTRSCKRSSCPEEKSPMVSFPDPQTILKKWEERHEIVSCDQLGETLRAAPTQLL